MKTIRFLGLVGVTLALAVGFFFPANAQQILESFKKPLAKLELLSQADFEAKTTPYQEVPMGDKSLAYKVRMPKDWQQAGAEGASSSSLSSKILGEVAKFYGPARMETSRSKFTIQAIKLDYHLTAEQWLLQYMLTNGYNIQGMESEGDERVVALFVLIENDISYIVRAVAQINGKRVVLAQYFLPIDFWDAEKVTQSQVVSSFALENPDKEYVESMLKYHFLDIAEVQYPESWELRAPPLRSLDMMNIELLNVAGHGGTGNLSLDGKMELRLSSVFATESLESEKEKLKSELEEAGLVLGDIIETRTDFKFNDSFKDGAVEVYQATDSNDNLLTYELWMTSMTSGDYYYFVTLLTPARDEDFFIWSRNTQTYKLVVFETNPQEESVVGK